MDIESFDMLPFEEGTEDSATRVFRLSIPDRLDRGNAVVARARELLLQSGRRTMIDAFERVVAERVD